MRSSHEEVRELIAAYVLGAVSEEETAGIRSHLLSCDECMAEADALSAVAAALPLAVDPEPPPRGFEQRVMAKVGAVRGVKLRARRPSRVQTIGSAALVLAAGILGAAALDARHDAAVTTSVVRELMTSDEGLTLRDHGDVRAKVLETSFGAVLVAHGFEEAPAGRTYQLWMMDCREDASRDCEVWSGGLFDMREGWDVTWYHGSMAKVDRVAVTLEPEGGSDQPTHDPICSSDWER